MNILWESVGVKFMEEKINIIKENLTGNYDEDIKYLSDFADKKKLMMISIH